MQGDANLFKRRHNLLVTLSCYGIKLIRFVVILDDKFSCLLLPFDVRVYSGKPITSSYPVLRSFELKLRSPKGNTGLMSLVFAKFTVWTS